MKKKLSSSILLITRVAVSAGVGLASGQGLLLLHESYFGEPEITLKDFYKFKSDYQGGEEFFLPLPKDIYGKWTEQEKALWRDRVASTWFFRAKRKSKFWTDILKKFEFDLQNASTLKIAKEKGKNLNQESLVPFVEACFDLANMVLDNPDHPDSWENKSAVAVDNDTLSNPNIYMKDSWVACSFKGTIASLDPNWPLYSEEQ